MRILQDVIGDLSAIVYGVYDNDIAFALLVEAAGIMSLYPAAVWEAVPGNNKVKQCIDINDYWCFQYGMASGGTSPASPGFVDCISGRPVEECSEDLAKSAIWELYDWLRTISRIISNSPHKNS